MATLNELITQKMIQDDTDIASATIIRSDGMQYWAIDFIHQSLVFYNSVLKNNFPNDTELCNEGVTISLTTHGKTRKNYFIRMKAPGIIEIVDSAAA